MHSWYQLGNIYSSQCKDQTEFMTKLKELSKETGFKEPDELTKFLFVIHNTDSKVREYLIDKDMHRIFANGNICRKHG